MKIYSKTNVFVFVIIACVAGTIFFYLRPIYLFGPSHATQSLSNSKVSYSDQISEASSKLSSGKNVIDSSDASSINYYHEKSTRALQDMEWDTWLSDSSLSDVNTLQRAVERIPVQDHDILDTHSINKLQVFLLEILGCYGSDRPGDYLAYLRASGETISNEVADQVRGILTNELHIPTTDIPKDHWELVNLYMVRAKVDSHWESLVLKGSNIKIYKTDSVPADNPGADLRKIRSQIVLIPHLFSPPVSISDVLHAKGSIFYADVTLFIRHSKEVGSMVRPIIMRLWYDEDLLCWRPVIAASFADELNVPRIIRIIF